MTPLPPIYHTPDHPAINALKARLRALARFTWHVYGCDHLEGGPKCDCGLDDLIQQLRKEGLVE